MQNLEGFRSQPYGFWTPPQGLAGQVQAEGIESDAFFVPHGIERTFRKDYGLFMTWYARADYSPLLMEGWQIKAAFVIQFRPETDIKANRFEGRVEHVASTRASRFHSLDELLGFIATQLAELRNTSEE